MSNLWPKNVETLELYQNLIPEIPNIQDFDCPLGDIASIAILILRFFHPVILNSHVPCQVVVDGNCLFRALSRAIYGYKDEYCRLILFVALDILKNRELYDPMHIIFINYIIDFNAECTSTYFDIIKEISILGEVTGLIHMYVLSAVLK